jgi:hypothetical protein
MEEDGNIIQIIQDNYSMPYKNKSISFIYLWRFFNKLVLLILLHIGQCKIKNETKKSRTTVLLIHNAKGLGNAGRKCNGWEK